MIRSELDAAGEAWEMRFSTGRLGTGTTLRQRRSRLRRIASVIRDAFEFFGYDGPMFPFIDG
jgi:hypothetical protein